MDFNLNLDLKYLKIINILYFISISIALISYQQASPYYRPLIFFIIISFCVALLGLEIFSLDFKNNPKISYMILKILLISLILRASAYFISSYPVGSDPWGHVDLINDISNIGSLNVIQTPTAQYYTNYPLMHIYASALNLIGNLNIKESMFIIGALLPLSTIFVYFIVKRIMANDNLALFSMLLLNFADFHVQWSIEVIAMTFGIAIYTIFLYLLINKESHKIIYAIFSILLIIIIIWTHTISGFILSISIFSLYLGSLIYKSIYNSEEYEYFYINLTFCLLSVVLLIQHWMDPNYPFFDSIMNGMISSLSAEIKFLGPLTQTNIENISAMIFNIFGFINFIFFGIIGCLCLLSKKYTNKIKFSICFLIIVLFFFYFSFPLFGLKNIIPGRWPPFIYVNLVLFIGFGFTKFLKFFKNKNEKIFFIFVFLLISSFFMITNYVTDMDSPIWGQTTIGKFVWEESEMTLIEKINISYNEVIITDIQTAFGPFETYQDNYNINYFRLKPNGKIDFDYLKNKLVVWRLMSLSRPVTFDTRPRRSNILLGNEFKSYLEKNFSCIYDTGGAKAYLGN